MSFWKFTNRTDDSEVVELRIEGDIVDDSDMWFYEWIEEPATSPNSFRQALGEHEGKELHVIIDTYGGSVFAAASIYSDLRARNGKTVGIVQSKAMSAGTVILMGCDEVRLSPTAILMIHDPITAMHGDIGDFEKALEILNAVKDSILNAYVEKTGLPRARLSAMMSNETWFSAYEAVANGFADSVMTDELEEATAVHNGFSLSRMPVLNSMNKTTERMGEYFALKKEREQAKELELMDLWLETL